MKNFIKIVFIGIVFSIFFIPLSDAAVWEECTVAKAKDANGFCASKNEGGTVYKCHKTNTGELKWESGSLPQEQNVAGINYKACSTTDGFDNDCDGSIDGADTTDCVAPTCSISSIIESLDLAHVSGTTIFYSTASSGSFTVDVSSTDSGGLGVKKVDFPATVSTGGDDTISPYSWTYNWDTADTFDASATATCSDNVDNTATTTFTVNRDVTPPSGGSISYDDGYYTVDAIGVVLNTGTDTESGVNGNADYIEEQKAILSGGNCGSFSSWSLKMSNPGNAVLFQGAPGIENGKCYKYRYIVPDNVNNPVTYNSQNTAKIDAQPPTTSTTLSGISGNGGWYISNVQVTLSCSDTLSGCSTTKYCEDASNTCTPNVIYSVPFTVAFEGSRFVRYQSTDAANNVEGVKSTQIKIDKTPPNTVINTGPSAPTTSTSATFTFSSTEAGSIFECKLDSGAFVSCISPQTYTVSEGFHTFQVRAIDSAGNIDITPASSGWTVDRTPPVRSNGQPTGTVTSSVTTLSLSTTEVATCKFKKIETAGVPYDDPSMTQMQTTVGTSHSQLVSGLAATTHRYDVKCADSLGNKNTDDFIITFGVCLRSNPTVAITSPIPPVHEGAPGQKKEYTAQVTNNDQNCGTEAFDLTKIGCPSGWTCTLPSSLSIASGSSQPATLSITSSPSAGAGVNIINVEAKNRADVSFKATASATYIVICAPSVSINQMPNFDTAKKEGEFIGIKNTWTLAFTDSSSLSCPATSIYDITSPTDTTKLFSTSGSCHPLTGLYTAASKKPPAGTKLTMSTNKVSITRGGELNNVFKVFVERNGPDSCTLSFVLRVGGKTIDPSFKVSPATGEQQTQPPQSPHVSLFDFSGDKEVFNVNWEAFYPDEPFREMEVKCGLNCDPKTTDCKDIVGKGCLPYPIEHGSEEIKKGGCAVSSPAFDFTSDKIICLFYDPDKPELNAFVNHDFTAVDFAVITPSEITTTVGDRFDLKIDVGNKGTLKDSYKIELSGTGTVDISPATITTPTIDRNQIVSTVSSIMPLVDESSEVTVKVTSLTSGKFVTRKINISPGLFALPEFGLIGFLQIIAIAAVVYFLLVHRNLGLKKRSKRR